MCYTEPVEVHARKIRCMFENIVQIRVEIKNCTFRNPLGSVSEITGEYYENETHLNIITRV